jgi:hypothetical protein
MPTRWYYPNYDMDAFEEFDGDFESNKAFGYGEKQYKYTVNNSFSQVGGFVEEIDVNNLIKSETREKIR